MARTFAPSMQRSPYIAYFDESGDHGLITINPLFPVFVLCGAVFKIDDYRDRDAPAFSDIKFRFWYHDAVVFHSRDIRKRVGDFARLAAPEQNEMFMAAVSEFFDASTVTLIAAAIHKERHREDFWPEDPYSVSLKFCLERLWAHVKHAGEQITFCVFEMRGQSEDRILSQRFDEICAGANQWGCELPFRAVFASKLQNLQGLQVADLAAYPIARHVLDPEAANPAWDVVEKKLRRGPRGYMGWGLNVFPNS